MRKRIKCSNVLKLFEYILNRYQVKKPKSCQNETVSNENKQGMLFRSKFAQKRILVSKFWKPNSVFGITPSKTPCVPIFRQNKQFWLFLLQIRKKCIFRSEIWKANSGSGISTSKIQYVPIFKSNGQFSAQISSK